MLNYKPIQHLIMYYDVKNSTTLIRIGLNGLVDKSINSNYKVSFHCNGFSHAWLQSWGLGNFRLGPHIFVCQIDQITIATTEKDNQHLSMRPIPPP